MTRRVLTLLGCLFVAAACDTGTPEPGTTDTGTAAAPDVASGPAFLTLHLYNPVSEAEHAQFLSNLTMLNRAVIEAGHPETQYTVWRVTGEQSGDHAYLFGSIWTDRAVYDAVHTHEAYLTATAAIEDTDTEPLVDEVYNRYVQLSPAVADPVAMPDTGPMLLALHRFNLSSADSEGEFVALLEDLNEAVAAAGHPETRYSVWKITGEQTGDFGYLFASVWADRAAYDAVHAHPAYQDLTETRSGVFDALIVDQIYNQYELVGPN